MKKRVEKVVGGIGRCQLMKFYWSCRKHRPLGIEKELTGCTVDCRE